MTVEICESSLTLDAAPRAIHRLDQRVGNGSSAHTPVRNLPARRVQYPALSEFKSNTVLAGWSRADRPVDYLSNDVIIQGRWSESASVSGGTGEKYDLIGKSHGGIFLFGQDGPYSESGQESS